ncbi:MAG TPA: hypothetical protein VHD60_00805 [Candidatus Saccharimonadales bacterium]|nr:hypothetical protein [Candidatus Saccharimonadales bacterium]
MTADEPTPVLSQNLLLSIAEQLKMPLQQIARHAELSQLSATPADLGAIQATADTALSLIDNYILAVKLALEEPYGLGLATEPVSVSAVLYDVGQQLHTHAKAYGVGLELSIDGKYGPVMAHRTALQAALTSLGYSLIEAMPAAESSQLRLQLAAHRCRYGIVAGLYSDMRQITTDALRQGRLLHGHSRQPITAVSHTSGAGMFVADALFAAMRSQLKVSRHHNLYGLGAIFQPNHQMQLV